MSGVVPPSQSGSMDRLLELWRRFMIASLLMLLSGFSLFWFAWSPEAALRWIIAPALSAAYLSMILRRNLSANHRRGDDQILAALGWGNLLTLSRGLFVGAVAGFLFLPKPQSWWIWLPGTLYVLSDLADFFDGYIARLTNHATHLGEILDMSFDGLGVLIAALLAVQYGQVPSWYLLVALARPLFLVGIWLRTRLGFPIHDLPQSTARRIFAGMQMGFLAVILLPVFSPPATHIAAVLFGLPLLVGFVKDWFTVSGWWQSSSPSEPLKNSLSTWLPLSLRLLILGLNIATISSWWTGSAAATPFYPTLSVINLLLVVLVLLGVLPRITVIFSLFVLGLFQLDAPLSSPQIALAAAYSGLLYLGGGRFSLWNPEEILFQSHLGERPLPALEQRA